MSTFLPVTNAELAQARSDPAFRRKLLQKSLDALLLGLKKGRARTGANPKQLREGVELAVRLAELIQGPTSLKRRS
jgi:hypothetical protein